MWAIVVVKVTPSSYAIASISEAKDQDLIEIFVSHAAVEGLDQSIGLVIQVS